MGISKNNFDPMMILVIELCNYIDYPIGGQLSFVRNMLKAFPDGDLKLVGITTAADIPVGEWTSMLIDGRKFNFFAVEQRTCNSKKPLIPQRIQDFFLVRQYFKRFLNVDFDFIFVQAPEVLFGLPRKVLGRTLIDMPGVSNPLTISRYRIARPFAKIFDFLLFKRLGKVQKIWATASKREILSWIERSRGRLREEMVTQLPTRFDSTVFKYEDRKEARRKLVLPDEAVIVVTVGRMNWFKGWKLMLDAFHCFQGQREKSIFVFIGDGEDMPKIVSYTEELGLEDSVYTVGRKTPKEIAHFLNAADLFVMGSFTEGWSTTLVEACACGVPCVVTDFSSAGEMIEDGVNGFVVHSRDEKDFALKMDKAVDLDRSALREYNSKYKLLSMEFLREEMLSVI